MYFAALQTGRAQVWLLFYQPGVKDATQNKVVGYFDGPFCHVEMAFPERFGEEPWEREVWGSSIYQDESVFFKPKTYQREGYVSIALELSTAQMLKIKSYCRNQAERGVPFSISAMYAAYLPVQLVHTEATFCSKHVTRALQHAMMPEIMRLNPALVSPSSLYRHLMRQRRDTPILQVVPSRMTGSMPLRAPTAPSTSRPQPPLQQKPTSRPQLLLHQKPPPPPPPPPPAGPMRL